MKAIDLFCSAGGVTRGLQRAGYHVTGVDLVAQPNYVGDEFLQADATALDVDFLRQFDFIWASPPCQAHTALRTMLNAKRDHLNLIPATHALLSATGRPWAIENVPGAPLQYSVILCGSMFGLRCSGAELRRHRLIQTSFPVLAPQCQHGRDPVIGIYGGHRRNRKRSSETKRADQGHPDFSAADAHQAMGIDWMNTNELSQAIPPAYAEWVARQARAA